MRIKGDSEMDKRTEFAIKCIYEMYKADWMRRITPERIIDEAKWWFNAYADCPEEAPNFHEWIDENGFGGELYACFNEFCECELMDEDYITHLVGNNIELSNFIKQYWEGKNI